MVGFFKEENIYKVTRITGNRSNLLGISFAEKNSSDKTIEAVEWYFPKSYQSQIRTSKEEVLKQVLEGLKTLNDGLGTEYRLSKIYYDPTDDGSGTIYAALLSSIILHYHHGNEFPENRHYHSEK